MRAAIVFLLAVATQVAAADRIVTAGGGVTEIVYALGLGDRVVGVDSSSRFPQEAMALPQVGYARALSAEGVLSLRPTHLVCYDEAGPPAVLDQLERAGVRVLRLASEPGVEAVERRIRTVAEAFGAEERAGQVVRALRGELDAAIAARPESSPRVLFVYARSGGVLNVSGDDTAADAMIELAGGRNAVAGYAGYKPLTAEAALAAAPDVILVTESGLDDAGGASTLLNHPGLRETAAAKNGRLVAMDDLLLLGFGPRLGQAVAELSALIRDEGVRGGTARAR